MENIEINEDKDVIVASLREEAIGLSSTVYGGGLRRLTHVVFKRVEESFECSKPENYAKEVVVSLGLPSESTAVFLTAADLNRNRITKSLRKPYPIDLIVTIGLDNLACIDEERAKNASTINTFIAVRANLNEYAIVDLVKTVIEAKSVAVADLGFSCFNRRAVGTVTDAVSVAVIPKGDIEPFAGVSTTIGGSTAKLVYSSIVEGALKNLDLNSWLKLTLGIDISNLKNLILKAYKLAPIPNISYREVEKLIENELDVTLKDPNVISLIIAAKELDIRGRAGTIWGLSKAEYLADSKRIIADEILGIALSVYVNGWRGLFNYYWVDRNKEKIDELNELPMFTDDIIGALMGSVLSRVYDRLLKNG